MWVDLNPVTADVEPGTEATVAITVRNTGDVVEEYHLQATGDPGRWCRIEPQTLRLYPGTAGTATLTFAPPRSSEAQAGPQPYAVKVTPREDRDNTFAIEGMLRVAEFADLRAELLPPTTRGWHRGRVRLAVDNYGNTVASAGVTTTSTNANLQVDIRTPALRLQPGRAQFSKFVVRPGRLLWFGIKARHQYNITVTPSGLGQPVSLQGTYLQSALLPRWLQRLLMFFAAAAAAILALWFGIHPSFTTSAQASPQTVAASAPQVIVTVPPPTPASSSSPKPTPTTPAQAPPPPVASTSKAAPPPPTPTLSTSTAAPPPASYTSKAAPPPPSAPKSQPSLNSGPIYPGLGPNLCLDDQNASTANYNPVQIYGCNGSTAQQWSVVEAGSTIHLLGKCLDIYAAGTANGTKVDLYDCNKTGSQVFIPQPNGSLYNPQSNKCLDVPDATTQWGTQVQIYDCNGTSAQKWTLP